MIPARITAPLKGGSNPGYPGNLRELCMSPIQGDLHIFLNLTAERPKNSMQSLQTWMTTAGSRIHCRRCLWTCSGRQCGAPALSGNSLCRVHIYDGRQHGPRTEEGRARCAAAKTVHGNSTRQARRELSDELAYLAMLEQTGRLVGLITGPRSRGRRPGYRKE